MRRTSVCGEKRSELVAGAGGIISKTVDMVKWVAMLLNRGVDPSTNRTVIPRSVLDEITTAHSILYGVPPDLMLFIVGYGMGWRRQSVSANDVILHGGGLPGFASEVRYLPTVKTGVVAFANGEARNIAEIISSRILEDVLELKAPVRLGHSFIENASGRRPPNPFHACRSEDSPSVSTSLAHFEGVYTGPGYGSLVFCTSTSQHPSCTQSLLYWQSIASNGTLDLDTLYGFTRPILGPHWSMRRTGDGTFVLRMVNVFPTGYGKDTSPFVYNFLPEGIPDPDVECIVAPDGSVVGCGIVNFEEGKPRGGSTVQERADVWFHKTPLPSQ